MRIHSSFRDYYDRVQEQTNNGVQYVRERREVHGSIIDFSLIEIFKAVPHLDGFWRGVVGFCGKLYPYYAHMLQERGTVLGKIGWVEGPKRIIEYFYTYETIEAVRKKYDHTRGKYSWWGCTAFDSKTWSECLLEMERRSSLDFFRMLDTPAFELAEEGRSGCALVINPRLSTLQFQKVVDPYQAFQKLEMFIGSDLAKQKDPEVHISDELRAESHGFDRWSFRKEGKNSK